MKPKEMFQLIDFDRTLFDTPRLVHLVTQEIEKQQPGFGSELEAKFEAAYREKITFFLFRYLRQSLGDDALESLVETVVAKEGAESLLLPGARERIALADKISDSRPSWGIMTFGDEIDQLMKIRLVGLASAPLLITDSPDKSEIIASWRQTDGTFLLPHAYGGGVVTHITLEDDKLRAFRNLPDGAQGIWVQVDQTVPIASDEIHGQVMRVANLLESAAFLESTYL